MNQQLNELKGLSVDLIIPPIIDEENIKNNSKIIKEEINGILTNIPKDDEKNPENKYQENVKSVMKKRREMFKEDYKKIDDNFNDNNIVDDEKFNKICERKIKKYKEIDDDLSMLSKRQYPQNRELCSRNGIKPQYLTIDNSTEGIDKDKTMSLSEKIKKIFNKIDNQHDYNVLIGKALINNNRKDLDEDLKDEYIKEMYEKIENINVDHQWESLFDNEGNSENELNENEHGISNNTLLQYKLYPFSNNKKLHVPKQKVR